MDRHQPDLHIEPATRGGHSFFSLSKTRDESVAASFAYVSIFTEGKQAANFFFFFIWPPVSIAVGSHALSDVKLIVLVGQEARRLRMAVINGGADEAAVSLLNLGHKAR